MLNIDSEVLLKCEELISKKESKKVKPTYLPYFLEMLVDTHEFKRIKI